MFSLSLASLTLSFVTGSLALRCRKTTGCGQTPSMAPGDFKNFTIADGREYRVWLPGNYDSGKPTPLILSYHGANRDIAHQVDLDQLTNPLFNKDHILVYLQGTAVRRAISTTNPVLCR